MAFIWVDAASTARAPGSNVLALPGALANFCVCDPSVPTHCAKPLVASSTLRRTSVPVGIDITPGPELLCNWGPN